jgi:hypothetical protein
MLYQCENTRLNVIRYLGFFICILHSETVGTERRWDKDLKFNVSLTPKCILNKKLWEKLTSYFPSIWHELHSVYLLLWYRSYRAMIAGIHIQTHRLMGRIYEVLCWDGLRWHDIDTKFHKDWFRHSKVDRKGFIDTQTARWCHKPTFILSK